MKNNNIALSRLEKTLRTKPYIYLLSSVIVCPWCYNQTKINEKLEENKCEVCRRTITEGDLENEIL